MKTLKYASLVIAVTSITLVVADVFAEVVTEMEKEVLLENEQVLVVRATYPVGTESGMHTHIHPNRVAYFVQGGQLEIIPEDTSRPSLVMKAEDGETLFLPATTHNVRNIGNTEIILLESEIKAN